MFKRLKELVSMYDNMLANIISGKNIIENEKKLNNDEIFIGFSHLESEYQISKHYQITEFPMFTEMCLFDRIRAYCIQPGIKINFYTYIDRHTIKWDSAEMRNKVKTWKEYVEGAVQSKSIFDARKERADVLAREKIELSNSYLYSAELEHKRELCKIMVLVDIVSSRDEQYSGSMRKCLEKFALYCNREGLKVQEFRANMIDWCNVGSPFSLKFTKETLNKASKRTASDDIMAMLLDYKQGRVGDSGIPIGMDINSGMPVFHNFKEKSSDNATILISSMSGGGKSYMVKYLLLFMLCMKHVLILVDFEGDEYDSLVHIVNSRNPGMAKNISVGKGSSNYFDPMEIPELTGDKDIDESLKDDAIESTMGIYRTIIHGVEGQLNIYEKKIIAEAVKRAYNSVGVTDNPNTWIKSNKLRLKHVYEEIKDMVKEEEYRDMSGDNELHNTAIRVMQACSIYFEEGEAKSYVFKNPLSAKDLYSCDVIVFSFGMRGDSGENVDEVIMALKQISVANIVLRISNYCKYIRKRITAITWEEVQRWCRLKGSGSIIINSVTGGRKRGNINIVVTNDLAEFISKDNVINRTIRGQINNYIIGAIQETEVIEEFCKAPALADLKESLLRIHKESNTKKRSETKYMHAFCAALSNGNRAVVKVRIPKKIADSKLFKTGIIDD